MSISPSAVSSCQFPSFRDTFCNNHFLQREHYRHRLLLVDDEPEIRDGLLEIIDWATEGFEVVGVAENGLEALQIAETAMPDLVVTDIFAKLTKKRYAATDIFFETEYTFPYISKYATIGAYPMI